jgi:nucleoside-diphosphate-sugar epimerase
MVTGATGFVGRAVITRLLNDAVPTRAALRRHDASMPGAAELTTAPNLAEYADWTAALSQVGTVVHCAARAHVLKESSKDPLSDFRRTNVAGTLALARQAAHAGVRRFVFLSSIGVNGAETFGKPFRPTDSAAPQSPYAVSKHEAELALQDLSRATGLEVVIIRPPLVYGPGAPGNFDRLLQALHDRRVLPLGAVNNRRSFVGLHNLVDLIVLCAHHADAANQTFLVSDSDDMSTTDLLHRAAKALGTWPRLIPVPASMLRVVASVVGGREFSQRLFGSLQVDIGDTRGRLGWSPPATVDEELRRTAAHFLSVRKTPASH